MSVWVPLELLELLLLLLLLLLLFLNDSTLSLSFPFELTLLLDFLMFGFLGTSYMSSTSSDEKAITSLDT